MAAVPDSKHGRNCCGSIRLRQQSQTGGSDFALSHQQIHPHAQSGHSPSSAELLNSSARFHFPQKIDVTLVNRRTA
jgi:hypothetical protein